MMSSDTLERRKVLDGLTVEYDHPSAVHGIAPYHCVFCPLGEHQPPFGSDSDSSIILGLEVGMSEVELSTEQECDSAKS